jgi:hypothetical protein
MKFCSNCGAEIYENAAVCIKCGCMVEGIRPAKPLKTNRSLLKFIIFSMLTFGIYGLVVMSSLSDDINIVASRYDGKKTLHYCLLLFVLGPLTLGIAYLFWFHNISERIGNELKRRNIPYSFSSTDFWLWDAIGVIFIIGPYIYYYKLFKAANLICADFNQKG